MSARFNHTMVSDDPQLEKQIGCMTGILHLLDGHHIKRLYGHKRITAGRSPSVRASPKREENVLACSRASRPPCLSNGIALQESARLSIDSKRPVRRSLDFRDVIKDSFHSDSPKLSTAISEKSQCKEATKYSNNPNDSPRKPADRWHTRKYPLNFSPESTRKSADVSESPRVLYKIRESPGNCNAELPRSSFETKDGERFSLMKNSPRFSCDGRETPRASFLDHKEACRCSSLKVRDSARISVDSMEPYIASPDSGRKRSPSVVARLMGLEEMPDSSPKSIESKQFPGLGQGVLGNSGFEFSADSKKILNSNLKTAVDAPTPVQFPDNDASFALEKKRKLIRELEKCDKDLQALKKIVEALQLREGITDSQANSETPIVVMKPAMLLLKSNPPSSSSYGTNNLSFYGTIAGKNTGLTDQNPTNTAKVVSKNRFSNDIAHVMHGQKRMAKKISCEESNAASSQLSAESQPAYRCQTLTTVESFSKLKSSSIIANKQRRNVVIGNKDEKSRFAALNTQDIFPNGNNMNLQSTPPSQIKRNLDFEQVLKSVIGKGESESMKAETNYTGKRSDSEAQIILDRPLENASEIPEQPSPVSVLDNSFYNEDHFPSPVTKCAVDSRENDKHNDDHLENIEANGSRLSHISPKTKDNVIKKPDNSIISAGNNLEPLHLPSPVTKCAVDSRENDIKRLNDDHLENIKANGNHPSHISSKTKDNVVKKPDNSIISTGNNLEPPQIDEKLQEFHYVKEIFTASGVLKDEDPSPTEFHSAGFSIDPEIFHELEQKHKIITGEEDYAIKQQTRQLVFDTVNDILARKFEFTNFRHKFFCKMVTGHGLLKQVCHELGHLPCVHSLDFDETVSRILQKDLSQDLEGWRDSAKETEEVVLGVERMIFRELIDEIIRDLGFCRRPKAPCTTRRRPPFS